MLIEKTDKIGLPLLKILFLSVIQESDLEFQHQIQNLSTFIIL